MATRLALRIQETFDTLAPSEQKLAALILERHDEMLTYSATELARLAGVSKSTAARLFRSLGYQDFTEVRLQVREERNRTAPVRQVPVALDSSPAASNPSRHLQTEIANLTRTFEGLRSDTLGEAAESLAQAPRLWVMGLNTEEGLARYARLVLARTRPGVQLLGPHGGALAEDLAMAGPRDALLVIALRPWSRILRPILGFARTTRVHAIMVTDPTATAAARRLGAIPLACYASDPGLAPSHTAAMSMLHLLAGATADRLGASASQRMDLVAEIHDEFEDLE